jgi:hypothetical protein
VSVHAVTPIRSVAATLSTVRWMRFMAPFLLE